MPSSVTWPVASKMALAEIGVWHDPSRKPKSARSAVTSTSVVGQVKLEIRFLTAMVRGDPASLQA